MSSCNEKTNPTTSQISSLTTVFRAQLPHVRLSRVGKHVSTRLRLVLALISVGLLASFQLLSSQALGQTGTCAACVSGAQTCTGSVTAGDPDALQRLAMATG